MDFALFINELQDNLQPFLPSSCDIDIMEDEGCSRIFLQTPSDLLRPGIPLETYYDAYRHDCPLDEICRRILKIYTAETLRPFCTAGDVPGGKDFLKRLTLRPLSLRLHKKLTAFYPYEIRFGILFFFTLKLKGECEKLGGTIMTHEMLRNLRGSEASLFDIALSNMKTSMPAVISPLPSYLEQLSGADENSSCRFGLAAENKWPASFYVLTNSEHCCGACSIFYPGMAEELYQRFGTYYLLPSSVHEVLILPADDARNTGELKRLIRSVNSAVNNTLQILSDELYAYDPKAGMQIV